MDVRSLWLLVVHSFWIYRERGVCLLWSCGFKPIAACGIASGCYQPVVIVALAVYQRRVLLSVHRALQSLCFDGWRVL